MIYKTVDLCAGIGGIRRGFELTGQFKNVLSAEIDELACQTYEHLYHNNPRNDLTTEEFKNTLADTDYDAILAGFPCQTFSPVGRKLGFRDKTKGTIFFDIAVMIQRTQPKFVFLENVENLFWHQRGNTFHTIIDILENELDYKVIGVSHGDDGKLIYEPKDFIRNSKDFGIPQNRPRVYIVAFNRRYFGAHLDGLPDHTPERSNKEPIYRDLNDLLDRGEVSIKYFLSSGYLETLEKHKARQSSKGYGFGMKVVNDPDIEHPVASTILATGGSGRERNLVFDEANGKRYAGLMYGLKRTPINDKCIRTMTPNEWGKLQGFINYGFLREDGTDGFSFPDGMADLQRFKQFGNSVTIPAIQTMAEFVCSCLEQMTAEFSPVERRLYSMYGKNFLMCHELYRVLGENLRYHTFEQYVEAYIELKLNTPFKAKDFAETVGCVSARAAQMLSQLTDIGMVAKLERGTYMFTDAFIKGMIGDTDAFSPDAYEENVRSAE